MLVCDFHHHLVHEGGWSIEGKPAFDLAFVAPPEQAHAPRGEHAPSHPRRLADRHREYGFRPQLECHADGRPDYGYISEVLAHNRSISGSVSDRE